MHAYDLYLASRSPRRRELLTQMGIRHQVLLAPEPPGEDEPRLAQETPADYVLRTARDKALRGWHWLQRQQLPCLPVLASDTCVSLGETIFGKPRDHAEAVAFLQHLSGTEHDVRTAVVLACPPEPGNPSPILIERICHTRVWMRTLLAAEIQHYCDSREPYDKAGGYGIQGPAARFITRIDGSHSGVMGLPLFETLGILELAGVPIHD